MKYLCLVIVDEKRMRAMSRSDSQALDDESLGYDETLRKSGHFLAAQALASVKAAKTVRLKKGKAVVTDGPFAETKEQVGGFVLIEAKNLDDAVELAAKIPVIRYGAVEVRPIKELAASGDRK